MPILSAEDFRLSSERKLAVHNCSLLRSVLISTLLSNLESDTRPFTAILAASCTAPGCSAASSSPTTTTPADTTTTTTTLASPLLSSPDRANMNMTFDAVDRLLCTTTATTLGEQHEHHDHHAARELHILHSGGATSADVAAGELDFSCVDTERDAVLLGDTAAVLDASDSEPDEAGVLGACCVSGRQASDADPEAIPVDIISVVAPRSDPLLFTITPVGASSLPASASPSTSASVAALHAAEDAVMAVAPGVTSHADNDSDDNDSDDAYAFSHPHSMHAVCGGVAPSTAAFAGAAEFRVLAHPGRAGMDPTIHSSSNDEDFEDAVAVDEDDSDVDNDAVCTPRRTKRAAGDSGSSALLKRPKTKHATFSCAPALAERLM